jgi:hypothetical protein
MFAVFSAENETIFTISSPGKDSSTANILVFIEIQEEMRVSKKNYTQYPILQKRDIVR